MAQVFEDHTAGRVFASRNWNELGGVSDRPDIDFRLQLRLVKDPRRRVPRATEPVAPSQYPSDVSALRTQRKQQGLVGGIVDGKFGNLADQRKHLAHAPRFLNSRTIAFHLNLRYPPSEAAVKASAWSTSIFQGGEAFEKKTPCLEKTPYPPDLRAFSAWRSQHKDVGEQLGSRASRLVDIRWPTSLRQDGPTRTEGHRTDWLGNKQWYHEVQDCKGDLDNKELDVKLEYLNHVKHILPNKRKPL